MSAQQVKKDVISVSLGTRSRDHAAVITLFDQLVHMRRIGTDGDLSEAKRLIAQWDGRTDAMGLGGIDRYLQVAQRRYEIPDAKRLADCAQHTPVVDGSGVKAVWEAQVIQSLVAQGLISPDQSVLMVSALDRFGMAKAFFDLGFRVVAGDLIFSAHINYPIRSLEELAEIGRKILPDLLKMPFDKLYPVGEVQMQQDHRFDQHFIDHGIIAGDFHYIRRYMASDLTGKTIITNTTTSHDVELLRERHARRLITTTPIVSGRSFGTNVIEAAIVATTGILPDTLEWESAVNAAGLRYSVIDLAKGADQ